MAAMTMGCSVNVPTTPVRFADQAPLEIEGLAACAREQPEDLSLDPTQPVTLLVHGCFASGAQFRNLSDVFEFHGQQTACFNYGDRRSIRVTALRLRSAIDAIRARTPEQPITVIGHSLGGMVSRIALSHGSDPGHRAGGDVRLVTVASPLAGIWAAEHCGFTWLHVLSLGLTVAVCQGITGAKWTEIPPSAPFWSSPPPLHEVVSEHLQIITDEEGSCRRRSEDGGCEEDDVVFGFNDQRNPQMLEDARVSAEVLETGHVAAVGGNGTEPSALIGLLQEQEVMRPTPPERREELEALLMRLYRRAPQPSSSWELARGASPPDSL